MKIATLVLTALLGTIAFAEVVWFPQPSEAFAFARKYPEAQRLLFAFDYGHALVYERLLLNQGRILDPEKFEKKILNEIIQILKNPPNVKVDESDIAPNYVLMFPLMVSVFDWSHLLHQFVFDVLVSTNDRGDYLRTRVDELIRQYRANKALAITEECKTMLFMDGQRVSKDGNRVLWPDEIEDGAELFSKTFRRQFPSFNLLIWSYHWFQIKLYEDLMAESEEVRDRNVKATINEFWKLISDLPESAEFDMMPEVADVSPSFAYFFTTLGPAFDNNHMMHDIVSDILSSDLVKDKRGAGLTVGRMVMDPKAFHNSNCLTN